MELVFSELLILFHITSTASIINPFQTLMKFCSFKKIYLQNISFLKGAIHSLYTSQTDLCKILWKKQQPPNPAIIHHA